MEKPKDIPIFCQLCNNDSHHNYIWNVWNQKQLKIKNNSLTLLGFSVAALRTNFYIKELNIMFDGGLSSNYAPTHVFVTHLHTDHIANCPWHFDSGKPRGVNFYVPERTGLRMQNMLEACHPYQGFNSLINQQSELSSAYNIIEVINGQNLEIEIKKTKYIIEFIKCYHTVRCTSYGLIEIKKKFKKEYLGLKGSEIKKLRDDGIEINETVENPFFLYVGDTDKEILEDNRIEKYSIVMIECTFIDDEEIDRATETKHMHWKHLEQYVLTHPNITFILYHFSSRYKPQHIDDFFEKLNLPNVVVWNSN